MERENKCQCGYVFGNHTLFKGNESKIREGDYSICFNCCVILKFNKDLLLIPVTFLELDRMRDKDSETYVHLMKLQSELRNTKIRKIGFNKK